MKFEQPDGRYGRITLEPKVDSATLIFSDLHHFLHHSSLALRPYGKHSSYFPGTLIYSSIYNSVLFLTSFNSPHR